MTLSLKPERLKRYKDVVALFVKYGRSDLVNHATSSFTNVPSAGQALTTTEC